MVQVPSLATESTNIPSLVHYYAIYHFRDTLKSQFYWIWKISHLRLLKRQNDEIRMMMIVYRYFFQNKDQHCNTAWNTTSIVVTFWFYRS
jgi:hypothetical protein